MTLNTNAKFGLPSAEHIIRRDRLLSKLPTPSNPIVSSWVWGPSGSGKSSLLSSYVEDYTGDAVWYRLGIEDTDLNTFIRNIHQATEQSFKPLAPPVNYLAIVTQFFINLDQQLEQRTVWVWDNCDCLAFDHPLFNVFSQLLDCPLRQLRMIFTSRHSPPVSFQLLQTTNTANVIDWPMLRLTETEAQAIADQYPDTAILTDDVITMHTLSGGWLIAFILLLQSGIPTNDEQAPIDNQILFDCLAAEVTSTLDSKQQDFLLAIAILPFCTTEIAIALSADRLAGSYLEQLNKKLHLIERTTGANKVYRFHALLTNYSHTVLRSRLSDKAYKQIVIRSAQILEQHQYPEQAADLYASVAEWDSLARICQQQAEMLIADGQLSQLRRWLTALPQHYMQENLWLEYWQASCNRFTHYEHSLAQLERVFFLFVDQHNVKGQYMTWLLIVETIALTFDDLKPLKHWIIEYERLRARHPRCPGFELKLKVFALAAGVMSMVQPTHPRLQRLIRICQMGALLVPLKEPRAAILAYLAFHYLSSGDIARLSALSKHLAPALSDTSMAMPVRLLSHAMLGLHQLVAGKQQPHQVLDEGMAIALPGETFSSTVHAYRIYCDAMELKLQSGAALLADFESNIAARQRMDMSHHDFMLAWLSALEGDYSKAFAQAEVAKELAATLGFDFGVMLNSNLCAQLAVFLGHFDKAERELAGLTIFANTSQNKLANIMLGFSRSWIKARQFGPLVGLDDINTAFKLAEQEGVLAYPGFLHEVMAELALIQIRHQQSNGFVETLVRRWSLTPRTSFQHLREWPWRVSIQTLGGFALQLDGIAIDLSKRANRRVVDFLQQLIALGGINVSKDKVCHALWPSSEGDKAHHALDNVLYRTRKLLGTEVLEVHGGQISFNASQCWVDSWALSANKKDAEANVNDLSAVVSQLLEVYKGEFLPGVVDGWVVVTRERLRADFLSRVISLGQQLLQQGQTELAVDLWQQAIDREPGHEPLYLQLAQYYIDAGRLSEAKHVYQHCQRVLQAHYDMPPSETFRALAERLSS